MEPWRVCLYYHAPLREKLRKKIDLRFVRPRNLRQACRRRPVASHGLSGDEMYERQLSEPGCATISWKTRTQNRPRQIEELDIGVRTRARRFHFIRLGRVDRCNRKLYQIPERNGKTLILLLGDGPRSLIGRLAQKDLRLAQVLS
jgi:hypothetical protein